MDDMMVFLLRFDGMSATYSWLSQVLGLPLLSLAQKPACSDYPAKQAPM